MDPLDGGSSRRPIPVESVTFSLDSVGAIANARVRNNTRFEIIFEIDERTFPSKKGPRTGLRPKMLFPNQQNICLCSLSKKKFDFLVVSLI